MKVDVTTYGRACKRIVRWAENRESRYVCAANVHMVMEAYDDPAFLQDVNGADLTTPDGMPLVWALRILGGGPASRVYGPDLMLAVCEEAALTGIPIGLFGGAEDVLSQLCERLAGQLPDLRVAYAWSPPFRPLSPEEEEEAVEAINSSGARILFVGLGCPRQEKWMARHRGRIQAVMLGVGAAFDFLAGSKPQAPRVLQNLGFEWLFRLACEPKRLWRRYAYHNPRFLWLFASALMSAPGPSRES